MAIRGVLAGLPLIASVEAALASLTGEPQWERLMRPLQPLSAEQRKQLFDRLAATEFVNFGSLTAAG